MKKLDFVYKRTSKIIVPLDSLSFMAARARYFATIDELRNNGTKIFWHDETWCNKNEEKRFVWTDGMTGSGRLRNAEGKGNFFIIKIFITLSHIGKRVVISALISNSGFHLPSIDIFECDEEWIEALESTFKPWAHKVEIFNKFVSNTDSDTTVSIDTFTKINNDITFFKVDIEGEEQNFLEGAVQFLSEAKNLRMSICTYHKQDDETIFTKYLQKFNFDVHPSKRFMIFIYDKHIRAPFLRRGILRCKKISYA